MNEDPLNIESTEKEKEEYKKFRKVKLITFLYFIGFIIPIMIVGIFGMRVANNIAAYPDFLNPLLLSLLGLLIIALIVGFIILNRFCKNKYGYSILETSPYHISPEDEPTEEDDQFDLSILGEKEIRKNLRNELIVNIFISLLFAAIGIITFFLGNENPGSKIWLGYSLLGFFILLSLVMIIVGIIQYRNRLKKVLTNKE